MTDSDSSTLSTPPSTDDEMPEVVPPVKLTKATPQKRKKNGTILSFFEPPSPARKKRPASPPHEPVPEDHPDIAFIVMFRSRFTEAFPPKCPHFGPQDIERGVLDPPSSQIESLLCALLGLVLNRKKPVEKGHYGRALEEAIQTQKHQWPRTWNGVNPLSGSRTFNTMTREERLSLLKALILWSLHGSEVINNMIKDAYKARTSKEKNDVNIPLSVQPWGRDGDKRRYWLVEGQDDTSFRVYRESNPMLKNVNWRSVAGSIDDLRALAQKLEDDGRDAKILSEKMLAAIPRFEATEEKRKRREYRLARKAAFARPEPGFSLYEGRTRGKRMKYTFSDEEEEVSDATSVRRSARHSGRETPAATGPTVTASGRQVRSRATGLYGESLLSGQTTERASPATGEYVRSDASEEPQPTHGRSTRANAKAVNGWPKGRKHIETYNSVDEMDDEDDATSSGGEWDGGDEDDDADQMDLDDDEDDFGDESSEEEQVPRTLIVRLKYPKDANIPSATPAPPIQEEIAVARKEQPVPLPTGQSVTAAPPAQLAGPPLQPMAYAVPNSIQVEQKPVVFGASAQESPPPSELYAPPKQPSQFSAPTPPYAVPEDTATKPPFPVAKSDTHSPFVPTPLPNPTPASSWQ
ncbi:hypothetical protein K469DRAFT_606039 [Zopfia rhizophila CBS 207.26]|uniref:WHIM1 domain-containing protein n=1 Tax=Zopfia rhizophila CBS 207.26 TaxID=1314779 RepID=A0A6A6DB58_9PEZI|nr:hypothetical protein K469DRAFT_606039 [Zopfia rhizophila CBS 207.26]